MSSPHPRPASTSPRLPAIAMAIAVAIAAAASLAVPLLASCAPAPDAGSGGAAGSGAPSGGTSGGSRGDQPVASGPVQPAGGDLREGAPWYLVWSSQDAAGRELGTTRATVVFDGGRLTGTGPVSTFTADYRATSSGGMTIGPITATQRGSSRADMRAGTPAAALVGLLAAVDGYTVVAGGELYLFDGRVQVLTLTAQPPGSVPTIDPATLALARDVVGMSESAAEQAITAAGLTMRVIARDGTSFPVTEDYRVDRVDVTVEHDVVTAATVG